MSERFCEKESSHESNMMRSCAKNWKHVVKIHASVRKRLRGDVFGVGLFTMFCRAVFAVPVWSSDWILFLM